jgi:hypothetical protein
VHPALIALAFAASAAPAVLAWIPGAELSGASQLGIALAAWLALAGVPMRGDRERARWASLAFALPPIALAAAIDLRGGAALVNVATSLALGLAMIAALDIAAVRAGRSERGISLYDAAWVALVVGSVCARFALEFGVGRHVAPRAISLAAGWSPLGWALALGGHGPAAPWGALAVTAILFAIAWRADTEASN